MANTALGYPYPLGTDRLMDGDNAIQALAQAINDRAGVAAMGVATVSPPSAGNPGSVAVTFPVGRFPAAAGTPTCIATSQSNGPAVVFSSCLNASPTGVTIYGGRTNSSSTLNVMWLAVQLG